MSTNNLHLRTKKVSNRTIRTRCKENMQTVTAPLDSLDTANSQDSLEASLEFQGVRVQATEDLEAIKLQADPERVEKPTLEIET